MKTKLRLASLFLALLLLASLWGCSMPGIGDKSNIQITNESTAPAITVIEDTTEEPFYVVCPMPDEPNFNCEKVGVLVWADAPYDEFSSFESEGEKDIVEQAVYDRRIRTEERLGVDLVLVEKTGTGTSEAEWISYVSSCVRSDLDDIDIIAGVSYAVGKCALQGLLFNMLDPSCDYLNFKKPYWYESFVTDARIGNGLYFATGDISVNLIESMFVCYANDGLINGYSLPDPTKLALDGKWTFEQLITMSTGIYTESEKIYGFATRGKTADPWFYASGARYCELDADGNIMASPSFSGDKVTETVRLLTDFFNNSDVKFPAKSSSEITETFASGHSLFVFDDYAESHTSFSESGVDFSILPIPKYNEEQERYYTIPDNSYTLYAITANAEDPARASCILECMASNSYRLITPAIYLRAYKLLNYTDDPSSLTIYDLLRESLVYDHGRLFADELIGQSVFRNAAGNTADWQSFIGNQTVNKHLKTLQNNASDLNNIFKSITN